MRVDVLYRNKLKKKETVTIDRQRWGQRPRDRDSRDNLTGRHIQPQQRQTEKRESHRLTDKHNRDRQPDTRYRDGKKGERDRGRKCVVTYIS